MGGVVDVQVSALHSAGKSMSGRSGSTTSACDGLKNGIVEAAGSVPHWRVKSALNTFHDVHILDPACKLPPAVEGGGHLSGNVAATTRNFDEEAAHGTQTSVTSNLGLASRITPKAV